ncbi:MAG: hypothetical protein DK306_002300 [Chloroflexi bacterium]|nr:MAG: hypothetical protein DK306_002300 [Chloroflexota bacterium]
MLRAASAWLDQHADAIDAINVFPVPDGDTGRNMAQTLRAAADATEEFTAETTAATTAETTAEAATAQPPDAPLGDLARRAADAALLGARGNSGVILSQWLRGLALALAGHAQAETALLADTLARASDSAYASIEKPREGTILSVARAAADCGPHASHFSIAAALRAAVERAEIAVARTPQQMPLLAQAGVVDSGAQGLAVVLAGLERGLSGADLGPAANFGQIRSDWLAGATPHAHSHGSYGSYGFCTEFVLRGETLSLQRIRAALDPLGDSMIVAGDEHLARVHLHTDTPQAAFDAGRRFGAIDRCTTDDMDARHQQLVGERTPGAPVITVAAIAVASGDGFAQLFRDFGASIVAGGPTLNPSPAEILAAARASGGTDILVLPNDPNVIAAARQAATLAADSSLTLHVVPTQSQPAAVAALAAWDRTAAPRESSHRMTRAAVALLTGAITHAARPIDKPLPLRRGQPFAMLGREIVAAAQSPQAALVDLVARMLVARGNDSAELLTIYTGQIDPSPPSAATPPVDLHTSLTAAIPALAERGVEIEVVIGGQPHYPFLLSLE